MCPDRTAPPVEVPLRRRNGTTRAVALVDAEDAARILAHRWFLTHQGYVCRYIGRTADGRWLRTRLHREVMGLQPGDPRAVDHINRDKLDNRRANLRIASQAENAQNLTPRRGTTSQYRGVSWCSRDKAWIARANVGRVKVWQGYFKDEHEAGVAVAAARARHLPFSVEVPEEAP